MTTRFDLETALAALSTVEDDLELVIENVLESETADGVTLVDDVSNMLIGVQALFKLRYEKVSRIFEALIHEGRIYPNKNDGADQL